MFLYKNYVIDCIQLFTRTSEDVSGSVYDTVDLLLLPALLIGVNHGAACRRNPLDRQRSATTAFFR